MTYVEKLKDPRWQKKRLEIMQRDEFKCTMCGSENETLHVHHGYYEFKKDPWDYKNETLWTLCASCHQSIEDVKRDIHFEIAKVEPMFLHAVMGYILKFKEDERAAMDQWIENIKSTSKEEVSNG